MENMDKQLTVPKMGADSSGRNTPNFFCPSLKFLDFNEKRLHWESVVRGNNQKIADVKGSENYFHWVWFLAKLQQTKIAVTKS